MCTDSFPNAFLAVTKPCRHWLVDVKSSYDVNRLHGELHCKASMDTLNMRGFVLKI